MVTKPTKKPLVPTAPAEVEKKPRRAKPEQKRQYVQQSSSTPAERADQRANQQFVTADKTASKNIVAALPPHLAKLVAKQGAASNTGVDYVGTSRHDRAKPKKPTDKKQIRGANRFRAAVRLLKVTDVNGTLKGGLSGAAQ